MNIDTHSARNIVWEHITLGEFRQCPGPQTFAIKWVKIDRLTTFSIDQPSLAGVIIRDGQIRVHSLLDDSLDDDPVANS